MSGLNVSSNASGSVTSAADSAAQDLAAVTSSLGTVIEKLNDFKEKANVGKTAFEGLAQSLTNIKSAISGKFNISEDFKDLFKNLNEQLPSFDQGAAIKVQTIADYAKTLGDSFSTFNISDEKINKVKTTTESLVSLGNVMKELRVYNEVLNSDNLKEDANKLTSAYREMVEGLAGSLNVVNGISTFEKVVEKLREFLAVVHEANTAEFANAADNLRAFYPLARTLEAINENIKLIGKTENEIQERATEGAKLRDGAEFLPSLYKSYSTLVDRINASVPEEDALAKFSKIANSLNNFSNGLIKIKDVQYQISVKSNTLNLLTPVKDEENEKKVVAFVEGLKNFVAQINGVELDDVNIERVNRLTKVLSSINSISENIVRLANSNKDSGTVQSSISGATAEVDKIVGYVVDFVKKSNEAWNKVVKELANEKLLSTYSAEQELEKSMGKIKEVVSIIHSLVSSINNAKALFGTLKENDITTYVGQISSFIKGFITSINTMWNDVINEIRGTNVSISIDAVVNRLSTDFENTTSAINVLEKIGHAFSSISKADSSSTFENVKSMVSKIPDVLKTFIDSFKADFVTQMKDSKDIIARVRELATIIETIASGFRGIINVSKNLIDVKLGFPRVMETLVGFVDEIKTAWGKSSVGNLPEEDLIKIYTPIIDFTKKVSGLIESLVTGFKGIRVATALNQDNTIENAFSDSDSLLSKCVNGIKAFWDKDVSGAGSSNDKIKDYEPLIKSTKDIASIISLLSNGLSGIKDIAADKDAIDTPLKNAREAVATFTTNLHDFWKVSSATTPAYVKPEEFDENLKRVTKVVSIINVMSNSLTSLSNLKAFNAEETMKPVSSFLIEVSKLVKDKAFKEEEFQKALDKLNIFSRALKQIASFINSSLKMSSAEFNFDIEGIATKITDFVNRMAQLAHLPSFSDFEKVANAVSHFKTKLFDATEQVKKSNISFTKFKALLRQIYTAFVGGAVVYSIVRAIKSAVKEMYNLEYEMARVNTIARVSSGELKNMTHYVQDMASAYGLASSKVTKALYDINSATIKGSASLKILEQSAKLAVAGFTDIEKVTDLLAKAVNAYEYNVSEASKISDILFVTVERGINPMEELSEYFGRLFTVSANAGVKLEEVASGLATLTARGYQTNVASTALNSAILKLSTGTKELNKLFQQYGYVSSASALRTIGLSGALQILHQATGGATEKLHDLGFNYRDIRAATTLASGAIREYNKTLSMMTDETYKNELTSKALAKVQDTVKFKFDALKASFTTFIQTISEYVNKNEFVKDFLDTITIALRNATEAMRGASLTLTQQVGVGLITLLPKLVATYAVFRLFPPVVFDFSNGSQKAFTTFSKLSKISLAGLTKGIYGVAVALEKALAPLQLIYAIISGLQNLSTIASSLDFSEFLDAYLPDFSDGAWNGIWDMIIKDTRLKLGMLGNVIDVFTFGVFNAGERLQDWLGPANYKDKQAIKMDEDYVKLAQVGYANLSKDYFDVVSMIRKEASSSEISTSVVNDILDKVMGMFVRDKIRTGIKELNNFKISENGYSEEAIQEAYDAQVEAIREYAEYVGMSNEDLKENLKILDSAKERLFALNKEFSDLQPNLKALKDVFQESRKAIVDNFEKHASELQKVVQKINRVQTSMDVLSKGLDISTDELAVFFSTPAKFAEFETLIHGGIADFAEGINNALKDAIQNTNFNIDLNENQDTLFNEFFSKLSGSTVKKLIAIYDNMFGLEYLTDHTGHVSESRSKIHSLNDLISEAKNNEKFARALRERETAIEGFAGFTDISLNADQMLKNRKNNRIQAYFDNIMKAINETAYFDDTQKEKLNQKDVQETLFKEIKARYKEIQEQPKILADIIADNVSGITPERRSAITAVASNFMDASKDASKFTKAMVEFNNSLLAISSEFSVSDVLKNNLKLPEVDFFKKEMMRFLGVTGDIDLDYYFEIMAEDMRKKVAPEVISKKMAAIFKDIGVIGADVSEEDAQDMVSTLFTPFISMLKAYEDFNKQFDKLTVLKHFNKIKYGGDMSAFNQYKEFGKKIIDDLKAKTFATSLGDRSFQTLYSEFKSKLESGISFEDIKKEFSDNYGSDAFNEFYKEFINFDKLVKEFYTEINELDFMKFVNKLKFGDELSAFKQYKQVDSKKISEIMGRQLSDSVSITYKEVFDYAVENGLEETEKMLKGMYKEEGEAIFNQFKNAEKEHENVMKGSPFALQNQYKNIKKQVHQFFKNYEDAFLTPMQQFEKVQSKLNRQFAKIKSQMEEGYVNPTLVTRYLENLEKLQKLNEEVMNIKVPATITASEFVKTGSKEAFDMIATNIFRDTYKVNVEQKNLQKQILEQAKKVGDYVTKSSNTTSGIVTNKGVIYSY